MDVVEFVGKGLVGGSYKHEGRRIGTYVVLEGEQVMAEVTEYKSLKGDEWIDARWHLDMPLLHQGEKVFIDTEVTFHGVCYEMYVRPIVIRRDEAETIELAVKNLKTILENRIIYRTPGEGEVLVKKFREHLESKSS